MAEASASIVRITSRNTDTTTFGTGFVVASDTQAQYVITCAHVVRDVGGGAQVAVDACHATVISMDTPEETDLAVLRVEGLPTKPVLGLQQTGAEGDAITVIGYRAYDTRNIIHPLPAQLGTAVTIPIHAQQFPLRAWMLNVTGTYFLEGGYSGSPVIDPASNNVIAVVSHREGLGDRGLAISIMALPLLWVHCPPVHTLSQHRAPNIPPMVVLGPQPYSASAMQLLAQHLHLYGIRTWPESSMRRNTMQMFRAQLESAHSAILYLSPERIVQETFTAEPEALQARCVSAPAFVVTPVLDGMTASTLRLARIPLDLFATPIILSTDEAERSDTLHASARQQLFDVCEAIAHTDTREDPPSIGLFSYAPVGDGTRATLMIDWSARFTPLPEQETWQATLLPTLHDMREGFGRAGISSITVYPKAHISLGLAFGYAFRYPAEFHFRCAQSIGNDVHWWMSDAIPSGPLLQQETQAFSDDATNITIEVSISRRVRDDVSAWVQQQPYGIDRRIAFVPADGESRTSIHDGAHAVAIAQQIAATIRAERDHHRRATIHLFAALPVSLAILLGLQLNKCGPIQCYELVENTHYEASCLLV